MMYETFEHTADVGLRVRADDLDGLFADAARGLFAILVDDFYVLEGKTISVELVGDNLTFLLIDFLSELLYIFDSDGRVLRNFVVSVDDQGVSATATSQRLEPDFDGLQREVKAITYHGARVQQTEEGWEAELILDV